jgi:hypothetical protein
MKRNTALVAGAAILTASALGLGGAALANAGSASPTTTDALAAGGYSAAGYGGGDKGRDRDGRAPGEGLSGEAAVKAVQAAVDQEPTAVLVRAGKAADGTYRVAMRRTDGTRIILTLDADFAVTNTEERAAKEPRERRATPTPSRST